MGVKELSNEIISHLQKVAPLMGKEQLVTLRHEILSLIGEEVSIMKTLDPLMSLFPKFKERLIPMFYQAFRAVDNEDLNLFLNSSQEGPIISANDLNQAKNEILAWEPFVRKRLETLSIDSDDILTIINAVGNTYEVFVGGNAGMGKGEVQYALLCGGSKPEKGDLLVPGFGDVELKGVTGRMRGVQASMSDNKEPLKLIQQYLKSIPQLAPLAKSPSGSFTLKKKAENNQVYNFIKNEMEGSSGEIIQKIFTLWVEGSYGENFKSLNPDLSLLSRIADAILRDNWLEAMACQAALQYDIYRKADGFRGILFVSPTSFFFVEEPDDLIRGVLKGQLQISPASLSIKDNIGAAAGLNIPQR